MGPVIFEPMVMVPPAVLFFWLTIRSWPLADVSTPTPAPPPGASSAIALAPTVVVTRMPPVATVSASPVLVGVNVYAPALLNRRELMAMLPAGWRVPTGASWSPPATNVADESNVPRGEMAPAEAPVPLTAQVVLPTVAYPPRMVCAPPGNRTF